jgi:hypothetical protein
MSLYNCQLWDLTLPYMDRMYTAGGNALGPQKPPPPPPQSTPPHPPFLIHISLRGIEELVPIYY